MSKVSKIFIGIGIVIILCVVGINIFFSIYYRTTTDIANIDAIEKNIDVNGYIIRDEYVVISKQGSFIDSMVLDGERVSKGAYLATVYEEAGDVSTQNEIKALNERIFSLEKMSLAEGGIQNTENTEKFLEARISDIVENAHKGKGNALNDIYWEVISNIDENSVSDTNSTQTVIEQLKSEKIQLEASLAGEKSVVVSDDSGMYFSHSDGGETILYPDMIKDITVGSFNELPKNFEKNTSSAKLVTGYDWYYSFTVDSKYSDDFEYANSIILKFEDHTDEEIKATVYHISDEENEKCVVTVKAEKYVEYAFTNRNLSATVMLDSTEGLKIPREAVRVLDGKKGVYIVKQSVARFREIEILAQDEEYVIVKPGTAENGELVVYDEVIVKGNIKKEGQSVK